MWSTWHNDSKCSVSCGVGVRTRIRYCHIVDHLSENQHNHNCPGTRIRTEICKGPPCSGNRFSSLVIYASMILIMLVITNLHFIIWVPLTLSLALLDQHALTFEQVVFVALIVHFFLQILNDDLKRSFVIIFPLFVTAWNISSSHRSYCLASSHVFASIIHLGLRFYNVVFFHNKDIIVLLFAVIDIYRILYSQFANSWCM